jgi:hypothetical protein
VGIDRAHEFAELLRVGDRREVLRIAFRERAEQIRRHVALGAAAGDRVAEDASDDGARAVRGLVRTARFDLAQLREQVLRRNAVERPGAEPREDEVFEPVLIAPDGAGGQLLLAEPLERDLLEAFATAAAAARFLAAGSSPRRSFERASSRRSRASFSDTSG